MRPSLRTHRRGRSEPPATREIPVVRSPYEEPDLYDLLFEGYREDVEYYRTCALAAGGPVLDLACGSGRLMLPMLEAGVDVEGAELESQMLGALMRKARERGLEARVHPADMRSLELPRRYALIVCAFNTLVHNLTPEDWIATLRGCRAHLLPGGSLVFDVMTMTPSALCDPDGVPVQEFEVRSADPDLVLRVLETRRKDPVAQLQRSRIEVQEVDATGAIVATHRFDTTVRWVQRNEMALMLGLAGFERWEISGGFEGETLGPDSLQMVVRAWGEDAATAGERS